MADSSTRRGFLKAAAASAALAAGRKALAVAGAAPDTRPRKPNVLIVFADQWRRQALGCNGDQVVRTPHLDKLAAQGVNFRRCYTTNPVCSPARAAFQTGRHPHQTGLIHNDLYLPEQEACLAECFRKAGYATGYIGKWHLDGPAKPGFVPPARRQGYEYFEGFNRGHYYGRQPATWFTDDGQRKTGKVFESKLQTDLAIEFMRRQKGRPFLLFLSWGPPHTPYVPPAKFDHYKPAELQWRPNVPEDYRRGPGGARQLCGYYGLCEALDDQFGRLMKFLDDSGLAKDTIVFFTADHGDCHGSHGLVHKGHPQEESLGIPLLVRWPGAAAGKAGEALVSTIDFAPTLLTLCGLAVPRAMAGVDFSAALGGGEFRRELVYTEGRMQVPGPAAGDGGKQPRKRAQAKAAGAWRAIVTERYKLAVNAAGQITLLSDLRNDPYELKNLADDPAHKALAEELLAKLRQHARQTGDPFPQAVPAAPAAPKQAV